MSKSTVPVMGFGRRYQGTIIIRPKYKGRMAYPEMQEALDGKTMAFSYCWLMDEGDKYPGEYALEPDISNPDSDDRKLFKSVNIGWIASGDILGLIEIKGSEMPDKDDMPDITEDWPEVVEPDPNEHFVDSEAVGFAIDDDEEVI